MTTLSIPVKRRGVVVAHLIVDDADAWVTGHTWFMNNWGYPCAMLKKGVARRGMVEAHREIMCRLHGRRLDRNEIVDHIDRHKLNCTRANLRITTHRGNSQNRSVRDGRLRGAIYHKNIGRWVAACGHAGKMHYRGTYATADEAAAAAAEMRREFGFLGEEESK